MKQILDIHSALDMVGGETAFLRELLQDFLTAKTFDRTALDAKARRNEEEAAKDVHYIKGAARQICAERLAASGQELEDVLRHRREGDRNALIEAFFADYEVTRSTIQDALAIL